MTGDGGNVTVLKSHRSTICLGARWFGPATADGEMLGGLLVGFKMASARCRKRKQNAGPVC
jgi:hypothetical protein